jgi:hypothetical protein
MRLDFLALRDSGAATEDRPYMSLMRPDAYGT